jgi:hypothetical protein
MNQILVARTGIFEGVVHQSVFSQQVFAANEAAGNGASGKVIMPLVLTWI